MSILQGYKTDRPGVEDLVRQQEATEKTTHSKSSSLALEQ